MIGWFDVGAGASGDMLLATVLDAGASEAYVAAQVAAVAPEPIALSTERVGRGALDAHRVLVDVADSHTHRDLTDVTRILNDAQLDDEVRHHALATFTLLAHAEAEVHGTTTDEVHFHEVGALDAIADIVGVCAGLVDLGLERLHASAVAVGSGTVQTDHGTLTVPPPAVVLLLRGAPTYAGPATSELCTPTGAALLQHWVDSWGPQPPMVVERIGTGAGTKDFDTHANVARLFVGRHGTGTRAGAVVLETNVDDLDPRLWPGVLRELLEAGASDAWLTPILMKKGRPAHTLAVLCRAEVAADVRRVVFASTSAIGLRESPVTKHELRRALTSVEVEGCTIAVKLAYDGDELVNAQPEFEDVAAAARQLGRPVKQVMAAAVAAAPR